MIYNDLDYTEIPNFPGYYINKETAQVISLIPGRNCFALSVKLLRPTLNNRGYHQYCLLNHQRKRLSPMAHQLLMRTFVPNPDKLPHINHIDGNKLNNALTNLEWCTPKHNAQHAWSNGLSTSTYCEKAIHQYDLQGNYLTSYSSIAAAEKATGCASANIVYNAQGKIKATKGFMFSYSKTNNIKAYTGAPVVSSITVTDLLRQVTEVFTTTAQVAEFTGLHRSKFLRRFKKSSSFIIDHYQITRKNH